MNKRTIEELETQLKNPLEHIAPAEYTEIKRKIVSHSIKFITFGLALLVLIIFLQIIDLNPLPHDTNNPRYNGSGLILWSILPILYGSYRLATIKSSIKSLYRARLIWMHPELKEFNVKDNSRKRILYFIVFGIISFAVFLYIKSLIEFAQN